MDQTAGSFFPTAACRLKSIVEVSTTPAVAFCSSEPTPIFTCCNPLGTWPKCLPTVLPVLPQTRRQNSPFHHSQNDDHSEFHALGKNVSRSTEHRFCSPVTVRQVCLLASRHSKLSPICLTQTLIKFRISHVLRPLNNPCLFFSRLPNLYQDFIQSLQTSSSFPLFPPHSSTSFNSSPNSNCRTPSLPSLQVSHLCKTILAQLFRITTKPPSHSRLFRDPQPFPPTSYAASSHPVPTDAKPTTIDASLRPIASTYVTTLQLSTFLHKANHQQLNSRLCSCPCLR